jgi:hypothetical protein
MTVFRVLLDCRVFILLAFHRSWLLNWHKSILRSTC